MSFAAHRDPAELGELVDDGLSAEAAEAAVLDSAERHLRLVRDRLVVDVHDARLDPLRERKATLTVAGDDAGAEPVRRRVCAFDRRVAMQICPWCRNDPNALAFTAYSRSASASTMRGLEPPSSSTTRFRCRPAASAMIRPTALEPVKFSRRTAGCSTSTEPIGPASPGACVTMFSTPSG